jgi:lipid-binding SYLF domain-containing protein
MRKYFTRLLALALLALPFAPAWADEYSDAKNVFLHAGESRDFFNKSYGYALFPTVGKGGVGIGGAYGKGRVYVKGKTVGETSMKQLTAGLQLGGQAYSQIVFFENEQAFKEFTRGDFEFGAEASAVAITAAANAKGSTAGSTIGASGEQHHAKTIGKYHNGMATFTVAKGGLMYEASVGGQKFNYKPYRG